MGAFTGQGPFSGRGFPGLDLAFSADRPAVGLTWRGFAQGGTSQTLKAAGVLAAGQRGSINRSMHRTPYRTSKLRIVVPLYTTDLVDSKIRDVPFATAVSYQAGIETSPVLALTGIQPRILAPISGASYGRWEANSSEALAVFDVVDIAAQIGRYLEADELFAVWLTAQLDVGVSGTLLPSSNNNQSSYIQRYEGSRNVTGDSIAANETLTAISVSAKLAARGGGGGLIRPQMILAEMPKTCVSMFGIGDSVGADQIVGSGQTTLTDQSGDARGNKSYFEMAADRLGVAYVNVSRGSDGNKFLADPALWWGRQASLALANPTCVDLLNGLNDMAVAIQSGTDYITWSSGVTLARGKVLYSGTTAAVFMVTQDGTAGTSAPALGTIGTAVTHGTAAIVPLIAYSGISTSVLAAVNFSWIASVAAIVRSKVPTAWIRAMRPLLRADSTDGFVSDGGTPRTGWGDAQCRGLLWSMMTNPALFPWLGVDELFDISSSVQTAANSGSFRTNGTAAYVINADGTHPTDEGHRLMSLALPAPPAVSALQLAAG